ncbi:MAG: hypothetical protein K2P81_10290 [Bacteriovoracaceae bacterium]|nr:hypothetical protein [Bacteriovoracaceae bacterium]
MPELPEVETIRTQLESILPFAIEKFTASQGLKKNILHTKLNLTGRTLTAAHRKGKMLDFILDDKSHLLSHLGMTGTWLITKTKPEGKHAHLILEGSGFFLTYDDPRRFGHLYQLDELSAQKKLNELGPDLASADFTFDFMVAALKKLKTRALKVALLDQKYFAGSGNYIANEICAHARIRPTRLCGKVKAAEYPLIFEAIQLVIKGAISSGGTTFQGGYRDTSGEKGLGVNNLVVFYQKTCRLCGVTPVKKIIQAQRGSYYCPQCQK